jgi:hypothetical protein
MIPPIPINLAYLAVGVAAGLLLGAATMLVILVRSDKTQRFSRYVIVSIDPKTGAEIAKKGLKSSEQLSWN